MKKNLLMVYHSQSGSTAEMANSVRSGCLKEEDINIRYLHAFKADLDDLLWADGVIFGTPENFGYMSGALKDFFDRIYYPCLEKTQGLPYALYIRAGMDGTGTQRSVEAIVSGLRWRAVQEPLICRGEYKASFKEQCRALGMAMAIGLDAGIF